MKSIADNLVEKQMAAEFDLVARLISCADEARSTSAWLHGDVFVNGSLGEIWNAVIDGGDPVYAAYKTNEDIAGELIQRNGELPWTTKIEELARRVNDTIVLRNAESHTQKVMAKIVEGDVEGVEAEIAELSEVDLSTEDMPGKTIQQVGEEFKQTIHTIEQDNALALQTGIKLLDNAGFMFFPGEVTVMASRPGIGKTALAMAFAKWTARENRVDFFSLEMAAVQLMARIACPRVGLVWANVRAGLITPEQKEQLAIATDEVVAEMHRSNMIILEDEDTVSKIHRACIKRKPKFVVIDLLGELYWHDPRVDTRVWYGLAVKYLRKRIAQKMNIPILLLHHTNRAPDVRQDKRPTLSDLRESGEIEQRADAVWFLHREDAYTGRPLGQIEVPLEVKAAKNRQGVEGQTVILNYNLKEQSFN